MFAKKIIVLALIFLISMVAVAPALASDKYDLYVNGESAGMFEIYVENGISFLPVETFTRIAGTDLAWTGDNTFTINENGQVMTMVIGQEKATFNGEEVVIPGAPVNIAGAACVPLRFVAESFGFDVVWDQQQRSILMTRTETRDGMTPMNLMVKSSAATQEINTYSMDGQMKMVMEMETGGNKVTAAPVEMNTYLTGQIQNDPLQVYMKQTVEPAAGTEQQETMEVETYMTAEKMYMKMPGQGWLVQDMPFAELWKQQQDLQSDPLRAAEQMKELGMFLSYGNDVQIDGQDYYVVSAMLDMEKFKEGLPKMLQQVVQGAAPEAAEDQQAEVRQTLQKMLESLEMGYFYIAYINKDTLISDIIELDAQLKMNIEVPENTTAEGQPAPEQVPGDVNMSMDMSGKFNISGLDTPFAAPDVSEATEMPAANQ